MDDSALPWARSGDNFLETKYPYVCHAELNAVLNKNAADVKCCRMYVDTFMGVLMDECVDGWVCWWMYGVILETKYPYVCHAEWNSVLNKNAADVKGCRMDVECEIRWIDVYVVDVWC